MVADDFDVIVVGGGIAGATLGGVLARGGLGVLVVEREARFRDRIRGEFTWPWGAAHVQRLRIEDVLTDAGVVPIRALRFYNERMLAETAWERSGDSEAPGMGFSHPRFQEAAFAWAAKQGAKMLRPAKATRFARNAMPRLTVNYDGREIEHRTRLVVAADGKTSAARRWTGGESEADPEHHRIGGVLVSGAIFDRTTNNIALSPGEGVAWLPAGPVLTRIYVAMKAEQARASGVDRSFAAFVRFAADRMPDGVLDEVRQEGPLGFFPNSDTWATRIAGDGVVLIGDAAGSPDPLGAHGTSLVFHDVRLLSELLLSMSNWSAAVAEFAERRWRAFSVIRADDRW